MRVDVEAVRRLQFDDGSPVRAASALARLGPGWLVAQDDTTHAAWWRGEAVQPVRIFPPVAGHEVFDEAAGTKHLKPDLEAACEVRSRGDDAVLLLGSGSSRARMRGALVRSVGEDTDVVHADLSPLYAAVARTLSVADEDLNLEGACVLGPVLRWFHRGLPSAGLPTASVDLDLAQLLAVVRDDLDPTDLRPSNAVIYDLGEVDGVGLAATDAIVLSSARDGSTLLVSTAAEDTPNARDDGPVVGSALVVLDGSRVVSSADLPHIDGSVSKVEGLALVERSRSSALVLATVDADDHDSPSQALHLRVDW